MFVEVCFQRSPTVLSFKIAWDHLFFSKKHFVGEDLVL